MTPIHLKPHEASTGPMCDAEAGPVELADLQRTYSVPYCVDCAELWRRTQRDMGVNVAALDCQRWEAPASAECTIHWAPFALCCGSASF